MLDTAQLSPEQCRPITRAEYRRMGQVGLFENERVELIEGVVVRVTPLGAPHDDTVERLNEILIPRLVGRARVRIQLSFARLGILRAAARRRHHPQRRAARRSPERGAASDRDL